MWNVPVSGSLIKYFYKESLKNKRKNTYFNSKTGFFPVVNKDFFKKLVKLREKFSVCAIPCKAYHHLFIC